MKDEKTNQHPAQSRVKDAYQVDRLRMVATQIRSRGVDDERVLNAMETVPRHLFVHPDQMSLAYQDHPLPIGYEQTISQPYIVAYMTEQIDIKPGDKVLEIGTGSGYQAAILSLLADSVFSIEIVEPLCHHAEELLKKLSYNNIRVQCGNGYLGWPEHAPFDVIMLTASPVEIPEALLDQLALGGRMILPLGGQYQELVLVHRGLDGKLNRKNLIPVRFVPMTGKPDIQ